jgi:hypothetical protein
LNDPVVLSLNDVTDIKIDPDLCFIQIFQIGDRHKLYRLEDIQSFESGPMTYNIGQLEQDVKAWDRNQKIAAIKYVRQKMAKSLKEAKEYVEKLWGQP